MRELYRRLRALVRVRAADAELDDEMRFHLEMQAAKLEAHGHSPAEARRLAGIAFGAAERFREESREQRGIGWLEPVVREMRLSLRRLMREPAFSSAAVATLAVGLGAATAVYALVDAVLLRPLPYPASERLVSVSHTVNGARIDGGLSDGLAAYYADRAGSFDVFGTVLENEISVTDGAAAERVQVAMLTPALLAALIARPELGVLLPAERGAGETPVLISWDLWQRRYGGDPHIIGRRIETNRTPDVVVGVMPRGFDFPRPETDVWMGWPRDDAAAGLHDLYLTGVARLRAGVSAADAQRELEVLFAGVPDRFPDVTRQQLHDVQLHPIVQPLKDVRIAAVRAPLLVLQILILVVLVIAWANVLNLVLLRAVRQRREVVIARALGAGTADLARRLLAEALLLCGSAGVLAVGIAAAAVSIRFGFAPGEIARLHEVSLSTRVIAGCGVLTLLTLLLLAGVAWMNVRRVRCDGLLPAMSTRLMSSRGTRRTQYLLVGAQVALALVLLVACAATAQSLHRMLRVEPGFDHRNVVLFELNPPARPYLSYGAASVLHARIRDALTAVPGVDAVEGAFALPLQPRILRLRESIAVQGAPEASAALINMVTPGFFDALRIPLRSGRPFEPRDLTDETPGVILSEVLARSMFGDTDPIGRLVVLVGTRAAPMRVVGVSADVAGESLTEGPAPVLFMPAIFSHAFDPEYRADLPYVPRELTVIMRTSLPAAALAPTIRRVMAGIDGKIPVVGVRSAESLVERATARARLLTLLLGLASVAALFLGAVGLWGVVAYAVAQRAPELALRIAVGAQPRGIVRLVLRQGAIIALGGVLAGSVLALAFTRSLSAVLFQVDGAAPALFAATSGALLGLALAACYMPARRALRIDPASLLRGD